ncbi:hypothetical protein Btru_011365 [Bulinus truncatus]|nr:hypothetical protein Btru_011365 [Bulinus truncatus]
MKLGFNCYEAGFGGYEAGFRGYEAGFLVDLKLGFWRIGMTSQQADQVFDDTGGGGNFSLGEEGADMSWTMMMSDGSMPIEVRVQYWTALIVYPLLLLQGIVGNLLSMPVLRSISRSSWSTVTYLLLLGVTDLIILLVRCGDDWYGNLTTVRMSIRFINFSDAICRTYSFFIAFTTHLNPWLIVAISVETLIATRWPKSTYRMCTTERAKYVTMLTTILLVCLDINQFWTMGVPNPDYGCRYTEEFSESLRRWILPALSNTVEHAVPLLLVTTCFSLTVADMLRRRRRGKASGLLREKDAEEEEEMRKYFLELPTLRDFRNVCLVVCFVFMCLAATNLAVTVTDLLVHENYIRLGEGAAARYDEVTGLLRTVKNTVTYAFYGAKIYLYLTLSGAFRARLRKNFSGVARWIGRLAKSACGCRRRWTPIALHDSARQAPHGRHSYCREAPAADGTPQQENAENVSGENSAAEEIPAGTKV